MLLRPRRLAFLPLFDEKASRVLEGDDTSPFTTPLWILPEYLLCSAPLVSRFSDGGCSSRGTALTLPDFRMPFWVKDDGPSADALFQGGDSGFRFKIDAPSLTRRFFVGGPSVGGSSRWPFVCGMLLSSFEISDVSVSKPSGLPSLREEVAKPWLG